MERFFFSLFIDTFLYTLNLPNYASLHEVEESPQYGVYNFYPTGCVGKEADPGSFIEGRYSAVKYFLFAPLE